MNPVKPEGSNLELGAPAGWDVARNGECRTLCALRTHDGAGNVIIQTCWEPTPEELAAISAGAPIVLSVWGAHPPVSVDVGYVPAKSS